MSSKIASFHKYVVEQPDGCWTYKSGKWAEKALRDCFQGSSNLPGVKPTPQLVIYASYFGVSQLSLINGVETTCGNSSCTNPSHLRRKK